MRPQLVIGAAEIDVRTSQRGCAVDHAVKTDVASYGKRVIGLQGVGGGAEEVGVISIGAIAKLLLTACKDLEATCYLTRNGI